MLLYLYHVICIFILFNFVFILYNSFYICRTFVKTTIVIEVSSIKIVIIRKTTNENTQILIP